jgi:hypothetical protein
LARAASMCSVSAARLAPPSNAPAAFGS